MPEELDFEVTVVTTLMFPRGQALRALASWTDGQSFGRERIQLVVASNGADRELEDRVAAMLRPGDSLLRVSTDNEMELYDVAARAARGHWLMFTEPHVVAHRHCLSNLVRHCRALGLAGACVRTLPARDANWVGELESRMYLEDADSWTSDDDWRKFTKRGVMLSRLAYLEAGGLEYRYLRFAEMALAARLRDRGLRLGYADDAAVTHFNSAEMSELIDYVREYQREACAFERDFAGVVADAPRLDQLVADRRMAEERLRSAVRALGGVLPGVARGSRHRRLAATLIGELPRLAAPCLQGPRTARAAAFGRYWRAHAVLWLARLSGDADWSYDAFLNLWRRAGDLGVMDFLARRDATEVAADPARPAGVGEVELAGVPDRFLSGFYPPEQWRNRTFRWSAPVATLSITLPRRETVVRMDPLWPDMPIDGMRLFVDGRPAAARQRDGVAEFCLSSCLPLSAPTTAAVHHLTLVVPRFGGAAPGDRRSLGVPLSALSFASPSSPRLP